MNLIEEYKRYHVARTDAEINFGAILFLQLIGSCMGVKCYNNLAPGRNNHNSYIALIGPSSRSRKSTVQDLVKDFTDVNWRHLDNLTPEQFLAELSENPGNIWFYGEWSKILKRIGGNHYLSDLAEITNEIFDCPERYTRKIRGKDKDGELTEIEYPHLCFNTTCTEEVMIKHLDEEMTQGGYLARFIMAKGDAKSGKRKIISKADREHFGRMKSIVFHLHELGHNFVFNTTVFQLTKEALDKHYEIEQEMYNVEGVGAWAGRYSKYLVTFADILMICEEAGKYIDKTGDFKKIKSLKELLSPTKVGGEEVIPVGPEWVVRAWEFLKPHFMYSKEVVDLVKVDKPVRRLTQYLKGRGKITWSQAMSGTGLNKHEFRLAVDTMEQAGTLYVDEDISSFKGNREYTKTFLSLKKGR